MKTVSYACCVFSVIIVTGFVMAADNASLVDQYKQERLAKRAYDRFLYAQEMLSNSSDVGVLNEAVQDAVRYANETI